MAEIIALANQKGGVGKTTTAVNLSAALAAAGQRVLLIDLDPQANATSHLGFNKQETVRSIYHTLVERVPLDQIVISSKRPRLDLAPAAPELAGAEVEMVAMMAREQLLNRAVERVTGRYDFILFDPPPSLGLLTVNALTAATSVIIPVQTEYLALEGLSQLVNTVEMVRDQLNPDLRIFGLLLTMYDSRTKLSGEVAGEVRSHFPEQLFEQVIPRSIRLSEAPSFGETIFEYDGRSPGAVAYTNVAQELLRRMAGGKAGKKGGKG
jgi:chromosome partitioning protein